LTQLLILGISLVILVILVRLRLELGLALLAAALVLGVLGGLRPWPLARAVGAAWYNKMAFDLLASLLSILVLENVLRNQGYLQRVMASLRLLIRDPRLVMALCASFLGLLPSAGGAVLSAPMVEEVAAGLGLSPEEKSTINYWYRHVWEYFFPLYPGIILAAKITGLPIARVMLLMAPFSVLAILIGIPLALLGVARPPMPEKRPALRDRRRALRDLLRGVTPVLAVIVMVLGLGLEVWLAVLIVVLALLVLHRYGWKRLATLGREAFSVRTVLLVAGIMAFRGMLEAVGLVEALPKTLAAMGLPPLSLVILLPMLLGALIGLSQGFVGASFPLLIGILGTGSHAHPGYIALAFVSGYTGVMLTPLHLCFVLTIQYFKASLGRVWLRVLPGMLVILLAALGYGWLWR